jgi:hypothetical protein
MNRAVVGLIASMFPPMLLIALAQAQGMNQEMVEKVASRMTNKMRTELRLTADQIPKVTQINLTEVRSLQQLMSKYKGNASADKQALTKEVLSVSKTHETQLRQVLTPQQWQAYEATKAERTAEMQTRMMTVQLNLTDQQIPQVEQINLTTARKMRGEMGDAEDLRGKPLRERLGVARDLRAIQQEHDQSLQRVLTPDQWNTYQVNKEEMREVMREKMQERRRQSGR